MRSCRSKIDHARTIVVFGDDKIGRFAAARLEGTGITLVLDRSGGFWRAVRMVWRRRISFANAAAMFFAELSRKDYQLAANKHIKNNAQLVEIVRESNAHKILLFRASLIVDVALMPDTAEVINIHCISIEDYPGLGAIWRALSHNDFEQSATAHEVTSKIDCGRIVDKEPYMLSPEKSYAENEDIAYEAGARLLLRLVALEDREETLNTTIR